MYILWYVKYPAYNPFSLQNLLLPRNVGKGYLLGQHRKGVIILDTGMIIDPVTSECDTHPWDGCAVQIGPSNQVVLRIYTSILLNFQSKYLKSSNAAQAASLNRAGLMG